MNDKVPSSCSKCISPNGKNELWKSVRLRSFQKPQLQCFNLLQVFPFYIYLPFTFEWLFFFSLNSVAVVPIVRNLMHGWHSCFHQSVQKTLKPGSHMPPSYLRYSCRYCPWHPSDMRSEIAGNRGHVSLYSRNACEVDSNSTSRACRRQRPAMFLVTGGDISYYFGVVL